MRKGHTWAEWAGAGTAWVLTHCHRHLLLLQEGVTSQTSHWSRLYFMTFYIVTMVGWALYPPLGVSLSCM